MTLKRLLVVEDDPELGPVMRKVLECNGFLASCACTAEEALRLWRGHSHNFDVAVVDLSLPGEMSGTALIRNLRLDRPTVQVIISSGKLLCPELSSPGLADVVYLQKPFLSSELVAVVRRAFEASS